MADDLLRKDLIAHKIYSAWQFIEYIEKDFDSLPDEIYILLVSDREESVYGQFDTILITGEDNNVLGRYCADQIIGDDCLLHYRKYVKDKTVVGGVCMAYLSQEKNKVFYHSNPYFDMEYVSNDKNS